MFGRCVIVSVTSLVALVLFGLFIGGVYYGGVVVSHGKCECTAIGCNFSEWIEWSHCSQECGSDGTQFRVRNVLQVTGCGPVVCAEPTSEERPCNRVCYNGGSLSQDGCNCRKDYSGPCCECEDIDCQLSEWSKWSSCENATRRVRSRDVVRGSKCAGTECKGPYTEEQDCSVALKGNVLVPKWIIITISVYTGLITVAIIIIIVFLHKFRAQKAFQPIVNQAEDNAENPMYNNEHMPLVRRSGNPRFRNPLERDHVSLHSNPSTVMG